MKKSLTLFLFIGMFLCFGRDFIGKEVSAQINSPAIIVQCPYCNATNTVYSTGKYSCFNCKKYFEVMPVAISAAPPVASQSPGFVQAPVVITPPPPAYYYPPYPYYPPYYGGWYGPGWYGPGINLGFGFRFGHGGHGHGRR